MLIRHDLSLATAPKTKEAGGVCPAVDELLANLWMYAGPMAKVSVCVIIDEPRLIAAHEHLKMSKTFSCY